ncbi:putative leucine-rich repeat-containing, plant-type, leucine-rich repeat domain superfamily [Helianthus annuus]|nr:putative leucine-rich repeat-containing, plant-type, leucine-rich repeat domain superfamily [Helianthus annuus]KAJ0471443.1 putative leucine-rich repeat-containing, plant-type, leucine-rich repeat domain superfamily [Helianthus annuus]
MEKSIHALMLILVLLVLESASLASDFSSLSHADECSLLFQFKESMSINSSVSIYDSRAYPKVASWNLNGSDGTGNCCLWDGVECRLGHVIGLDLSSSFLSGPISSNNSLFNLIHLRTLNLANNDFRSSQIPSGIGRLSQLIKLNLSYSFFSGEVPKQISHLRNLVSLDLRGNGYHSLKLQSSDFQNLVQNTSETLRELFLSEVNIDFVPDSLVNSSSLTSLVMSSCGLSGDFPTDILYLQKLQVLDVGGSIPASIGNLTHLNVLDLRSNAFTGTLPASVSNLTQLTYLDLSYNNFDRWKLPDWFGKLNKITYLDLLSVNLYGEIPSSFSNLTQLEHLDVSFNQLKGELSSSWMNFQNLELFYLAGNNVTANLYLFLSLKKLKSLNLSGNNITLSVIDSHINGTQPQFIYISLGYCNLKVFPEFLRFQHQLRNLYLANNNIEGLIPRWMWNISKNTLSELWLHQNLLMGFEQHSPVASWVNLRLLDLSHNMLHGEILMPPPTTEYFSVSNNNLTGGIPPSICDLLSLQLLDLSFNNIIGSIPPCLEKLSNSNLTVLNLRSNALHGTIPNIFANGSKLQFIDLSENILEGQVPRSLEDCKSLQILDLGYNFIGDVFPVWLGALPELQVLILRFNNFHGIIRRPSRIKVNFPKLRIIDLSYNSFSGDLPHQYFQEWSAMKESDTSAEYMLALIMEYDHSAVGYWLSIQITNKGVKTDYEKISEAFFAVDLSGNMFRGNIPESITTLSGLQLLNLSNNELSGTIPPSMGNLIHLESLDLSSNKLSGMIPQDLVRLNFLAVFNVSNNNLSGPIPQGKQFNTFLNNSYIGNQALCGFPSSKKCGDSEASKPPKASFEEDTESDFPNGVDWVVILIGVVIGLVIGLVYGDYLSIKYYKWFSQRSRR